MPGDVNITIVDGGGGQVIVPSSKVQFLAGPTTSGTANQVVATRSQSTLVSQFGGGPMVEAAALAIAAGATVLAVKTTTTTPGSVVGSPSYTSAGGSVVTISGAATDDAFLALKVVSGGAIGSGPTFQLSADAGRTYGPTLSLGTASTYVVPGLGVTISFAAGSITTGEVYRFTCVAPVSSLASYQAAIVALTNSSYSGVGWGSSHLVTGLAGFSGSDGTTLQGYLDTMRGRGIYPGSRPIVSARDVGIPVAWGSTVALAGESESAWMNGIGSSWSATSAKCLSVAAGAYNVATAFPSAYLGAVRFRRPLAWSYAQREVDIPPQRHAGRVKDGALAIVVDPVNDPNDGFLYHDEDANPGLDYKNSGVGVNRFAAAKTRRPGLPGFYLTTPLLMSPIGSDYWMLPLGNAMDLACAIVLQVGQTEHVNTDLRTFPVTPSGGGGNLYPNDVATWQTDYESQFDAQLVSKSIISDRTVTVDGASNVQLTQAVNVAISITARGYVLKENVTIGFNNQAAAQAST